MGDTRGPVTTATQPSAGYASYDYNSSYNYGSTPSTQSNYGTANPAVSSNQQWNQSDQYCYPSSHYGQQNQSSSTGYNYSAAQYGAMQVTTNQAGYNLAPQVPPPSSATHNAGPPYQSYSTGPSSGYHDNGGGSSMRNQPSYRGGLGGGRNTGPGFNKGRNSGYGGYDNKRQHEEIQDTIFISGLPEDATEEQIAEYFGSIGVIKSDKKTGKAKIWIYKDKHSGKSKGEATVTYDDPPTANSSITWFNGKDFRGNKIKVELAQRKQSGFGDNRKNRGPSGGSGGGGGGRMNRGNQSSGSSGGMNMNRNSGSGGGSGRSGSGGGQSSGGRQGDWRCPNPNCNNNNFSWRTQCNRCQTPKPDGGVDGRQMTPQVVDSRRGGGMIPPVDSRRMGTGGMRGSNSGSNNSGGGGGGGGGRNNRGGNSGGGFGGRGGRGGGPSQMRGRGGGPMRGGHDRRQVPY